jgi:phage terminase large subunit-like protein
MSAMEYYASSLALLPPEKREAWLNSLSPEELEHLDYDWQFWARPEQLAPPGNWHTWLILAGRGAGKTRTGGEWVKANVSGSTPLAKGKYSRFALVAETASDARDVIVEGESGLLAIHHRDYRPTYEPSKRRLTWPNGAVASLYNATEPDQLRGPQFDAAWLDELAKWKYAEETWNMLQFGPRLGSDPRQVITTTPRPIPLLKDIMASPHTIIARGSTYDNQANLAPQFLAAIVKRYEGTRLGRQELSAEILDDVAGALWTRTNLDQHRRRQTDKLPDMQRVVVGIDPAANANATAEEGAETGIVVAALGMDGRGYILDDLSCRLSPMAWARMAIAGFDRYQADTIVVETNQGGAMVEAVLRSERDTLPVVAVHASRGKVTRAEPIAALYEQGRVSHVGSHATLEDQMVLFTPNGIMGDTTADRVDALVWALTSLFPDMISRSKTEWHDKFSPAYLGLFEGHTPGGWMRG